MDRKEHSPRTSRFTESIHQERNPLSTDIIHERIAAHDIPEMYIAGKISGDLVGRDLDEKLSNSDQSALHPVDFFISPNHTNYNPESLAHIQRMVGWTLSERRADDRIRHEKITSLDPNGSLEFGRMKITQNLGTIYEETYRAGKPVHQKLRSDYEDAMRKVGYYRETEPSVVQEVTVTFFPEPALAKLAFLYASGEEIEGMSQNELEGLLTHVTKKQINTLTGKSENWFKKIFT